MWWQTALALLGGVVLLLATALRMGARRMDALVEAELRRLREDASPSGPAIVSLAEAEGLPEPVRRYLQVAGVDGRAPLDFVRMRHGGTFSTDGGERWRPIRGEEYFSADPPGFLWSASIPVAPGVAVRARDRYLEGEGAMLVTVGGLLTLQDLRGPEMDEASLLRWVSELPVMPSALVPDERISWEPVDASSARVRCRDRGLEVSGVYRFDPDGLPTSFTARRYRSEDGEQVLRGWRGWYGAYRRVDGVAVPGAFGVAWVVDGREAPYVRFELDEIDFDERSRW